MNKPMTILEKLQTRPEPRPIQRTPAPVSSDNATNQTDIKKLDTLRAKAKGK